MIRYYSLGARLILLGCIQPVFWLLFSGVVFGQKKTGVEISIITDSLAGDKTAHGLDKLTETLKTRKIPFEKVTSLEQAKGRFILVTGLADDEGVASTLLTSGKHTVDKVPEALTIWQTRWRQKPVTVISGYDDQGLMYGLLDVTKEIGWNRDTPS